MKRKAIVVFGLGQFGAVVAKELANMGHDVLAVDKDEQLVQRISAYVTHAVAADATDEEALRALALSQFDVAIVAIGHNQQGNLLTAMLLKEAGLPYVVAKAQDAMQGRLLKKIGVNLVIYPEMDMARRVAQQLSHRYVLDYLQLADNVGLNEIELPKGLVGRNLIESKLRARYQLNVVALKRGDDFIMPPDPREPLQDNDKLLIIGKDSYMARFDAGK